MPLSLCVGSARGGEGISSLCCNCQEFVRLIKSLILARLNFCFCFLSVVIHCKECGSSLGAQP